MSDQLLETQILGVEEKTVNTKNGAKTIYEVQVDGGHVYSTFIKEIADQARAAIFQNVTMAVKIQQNGNFLNRYLQKIIATSPGVAPVQQAPVQAAPQPVQPVTSHNQDDGLFPPITVQQADEHDKKKTEQIHRQVACKVAANLVQPGDSQLDFWQNVDQLMQFFATGVKPLAVAIQLDERAA